MSSAQPPSFDYAHNTYLVLTTASPPASIQVPLTVNASSSGNDNSSDASLTTIEHVCSLKPLEHEHMYVLRGVPSQSGLADEATKIQHWLEAQAGYKRVELMQVKQRAKR
ncbi:hypothetical protein ACM66B_002207 [Microbotryomycetes sp. NB124-2]